MTLYLLISKEEITENEIIETFKESGVLKTFEKLSKEEKDEIIRKIISQKSEEKQVKTIWDFIDQFSRSND